MSAAVRRDKPRLGEEGERGGRYSDYSAILPKGDRGMLHIDNRSRGRGGRGGGEGARGIYYMVGFGKVYNFGKGGWSFISRGGESNLGLKT